MYMVYDMDMCMGQAVVLLLLLQAWAAAPLLLVEQACRESHQEVGLCGQGAQGHAAAQA